MRTPTFLFMAACGGAEIGPTCEQYLACVGATTPECSLGESWGRP